MSMEARFAPIRPMTGGMRAMGSWNGGPGMGCEGRRCDCGRGFRGEPEIGRGYREDRASSRSWEYDGRGFGREPGLRRQQSDRGFRGDEQDAGPGASGRFGAPLEVGNLRVQARDGYRAAALRLGGGLLLVAEVPERTARVLEPDYVGMLSALITHAALQELLGRVLLQAPPPALPSRPDHLPVHAPPTTSGEFGAGLVHAGPNASVSDQLLALAVNSAAPMATQLITSQLQNQVASQRPGPTRPVLPRPGPRAQLAGSAASDGHLPGWLKPYVSGG